MVLNRYRKNVDSLLTLISKPFMRMSPNTITAISLGVAALAGLAYYRDFLLISFALMLFASVLDAVDGKVARLRGISSKRGDFLDHTVDRYADTFLLLGLMFSPYGTLWLGVFALVGVYMTSYLGTQAQALGLGRIYGGVLGRADRLVIMMLLALIQPFLWGYYLSLTDWVLLIFAVLGNITAIQRFVSAWRALS